MLALLAGSDDALEEKVFESGAIECCLEACQSWPDVEDVLGTAFEAIGLICRSEDDDYTHGENPYGDKTAWARKKAAVELGALEVISSGMHSSAHHGAPLPHRCARGHLVWHAAPGSSRRL